MMMKIANLKREHEESNRQEKFGIGENIKFFTNDSGLDYAELTHPSGRKPVPFSFLLKYVYLKKDSQA